MRRLKVFKGIYHPFRLLAWAYGYPTVVIPSTVPADRLTDDDKKVIEMVYHDTFHIYGDDAIECGVVISNIAKGTMKRWKI